MLYSFLHQDGTSMCGRIGFAWWNGAQLDSDAKQWRLFADVLNDAAIFLELVSQVENDEKNDKF